MSKKKVSIIVPVYNSEKTIKECIASIQRQSYELLEIICINDGSKDNSKNLLEELAKRDSRIVVVNQENQGVSSARNNGLKVSTGEYVQFVDSDDQIDFNMVEKMVSAMEETGSDLVICGYRFTRLYEPRIPKKEVLTREQLLSNLFQFYVDGFVCSTWNKLYKKSLIYELFNCDMDLGEDAVFNLEYMSNIDYVSFVDEAFYLYSIDNINSLSWKYNEKALSCEEAKNKKILSCVISEDVEKRFKKEFLKDFKRCIDNEILGSSYKKKELVDRIKSHVETTFWNEILAEENLLKCNNKTLVYGINSYVTRLLLKKKCIAFKKAVKMLLQNSI